MNGITKKIGQINYTGLSPDEIRKMSAVKVITADTYDDEGYPIERGLMDPHMGVVEPGLRCKTCGNKVDECPGHFGSVELARPVIHVLFAENIKSLLEITCSHCGRLLFNDDQIKDIISSRERTTNLSSRLGYKFIKELSRKLTGKVSSKSPGRDKMQPVMDIAQSGPKTAAPICPHCHTEQKKLKLDKPTTFREVDSNTKLTPQEIRDWFERIPDEDLRTIGIDPDKFRPEWMILTVLPVPPVCVRPSITVDSGERSEDDLTHKLVDVIRINERLRENRDSGAPQLIVEDLWELLQYHITTYFNNQSPGIPPARHRSGRSLKTLNQRLKGKEGRFRSNLSGKRVNFSARTVISPDPLLSINEVGVPIAAARELTVPLYVNEDNLELCRSYVRKGIEPVEIIESKDIKRLNDAGIYCVGYDPETGDTDEGFYNIFRNSEVEAFEAKHSTKIRKKYTFGINYITRADGRKIRVTDKNCAEVSKNVDCKYRLERQLVDGDIVLFNRQPSLHRMSMMAHRVRMMEGRTFRFNLCVCPPYNADFDGDEMNLHVLQSEESRAEARVLMQVQENILSPRYGGPIIGAIHDHITGAYFLTNKNPRFYKQDAMSILTKLDNIDYSRLEPFKDENGVDYWTGKQLFSIVLPTDLNLKFKSKICHGCLECKKEQCEYDAYVKIKDGNLVCGTIDVNGIGNSKGKILERITRDYGSARGAQFVNEVTRIALGALMNRGFSTGIDDEDITDDSKSRIEEINREKILDVEKLIDSYNNGTLEQMPGRTIEQTLEVKAKKTLEDARNSTGDIVADEDTNMVNPAVIMAKTGARGNMLNLSQMAGCVGQQTVRGERIERGYADRTLPHFQREDLGAFARGYVAHSYKDGLSPTEFFFHAMGGREGLVDTAVRTSRSGYLQRKLVTAFIDLKLMEDSSVRDSEGSIIQFKYGEDGIDPARSVKGKSIDLNDLFVEVFEDDADKYLKFERKQAEDSGEATTEDTSEPEETAEGDEIDQSDDMDGFNGGE